MDKEQIKAAVETIHELRNVTFEFRSVDEQRRMEAAGDLLLALAQKVAEAPVWVAQSESGHRDCVWLPDEGLPLDWEDEQVALVRLGKVTK